MAISLRPHSAHGVSPITYLGAPLIPKLRGHFAEFLNEGSLARLRILSLPTCVGLRYGHYLTSLLETISWQYGISHFATITAAPLHLSGLCDGRICLSIPLRVWPRTTNHADDLPCCEVPSVSRCKAALR